VCWPLRGGRGTYTQKPIKIYRKKKKIADYQNGAFAISPLCIFWPIFKNTSRKRNYQIMRVDIDTDTDE
jgi:hypothetical protein